MDKSEVNLRVTEEANRRSAGLTGKLLAPLASVLLVAACAGETKQQDTSKTTSSHKTETEAIRTKPEAEITQLKANINGSKAEQAAFWADGAGDGYADETDLNIASDFQRIANDHQAKK